MTKRFHGGHAGQSGVMAALLAARLLGIVYCVLTAVCVGALALAGMQGFDARNLGPVAITIWYEGRGYYFAASEAPQLEALLDSRTVETALSKRAA